MPTPVAKIPKPAANVESLRRTLDALLEAIRVREGLTKNQLDGFVSWRDLLGVGIARVSASAGTGGYLSGLSNGSNILPYIEPGSGSTAIPPAPEGFIATGGFAVIILEWDEPTTLYGNHAYTEIWRAATDDFGAAVRIGTSGGSMYVDAVGNAASYYYWIRFVSTSDIIGPLNATAGTSASTSEDPAFVLSVLEGQITATHLATALAARIDLVDTPTTGLVDRMTTAESSLTSHASSLATHASNISTNIADILLNATDISALEATVNNATTGVSANATNIAALDVRVTQNEDDLVVQTARIDQLAAQVYSFDPDSGITWNFDTDEDGFTATNGTITSPNNGYIEIDATGTYDLQLISPTFSLDSADANVVAFRVRRLSGSPTWVGKIYYKRSGDSTWDTARSVTISEPIAWGTGDWIVLRGSFVGDTNWTGTITQIRIDLADTAVWDAELDWVGVLLDTDSALADAIDALDVRVTQNETDITANATDITALEAVVYHSTTGVSANAAAIAVLDASVSTNSNGIAANVADITALEVTVNSPTTGVSANAAAIATLDASVSTNSVNIAVNVADIAALEATVNNPTTGVSANASALSAQALNISTNSTNIAVNATDIAALEATVNNPTTGVSANASAIDALDVRVTANEGDISAQATSITVLEAEVDGVQYGEPLGVYDGASLPAVNIPYSCDIFVNNDQGVQGWYKIFSHNPDVANSHAQIAGRIHFGSDNLRVRESMDFNISLEVGSPATTLSAATYKFRGHNLSTVLYARHVTEMDGTHTLNVYVKLAANESVVIDAYVTVGATLANSWIDTQQDHMDTLGTGDPGGSAINAALDDYTYDQLDASKATIIYVDDAIATEQAARASAVSNLQAQIDGNSADIATEATTRATADGLLNAEYTVKTQVRTADGQVAIAGFGVAVSGGGSGPSESQFYVLADQFAILDPGSVTIETPFIVDSGTVYIKDALIQDAAITNAKIGALAVDSAKIADAAIVTAKINDLAVSEAKIASAAITSAKIANAAILTAAIADAQITTAKIADAQVDTLKIADNAVVVPASAYVASASYTTLATGDGWTDVPGVTVSVDPEGQPVLLTLDFKGPMDTTYHLYQEFRVVDGATVMGPASQDLSRENPAPAVFRPKQFHFTYLDTRTGTGTRTYKAQVRTWYSSGYTSSSGPRAVSDSWIDVSLTALGVKR